MMIIDDSKFQEACSKNMCKQISEEKPCEIVRINGINYIITGSLSTGNGGFECCWGYQVIPLISFRGNDKDLATYSQSVSLVYQGKRSRGYINVIIKVGKSKCVIMDPKIEFRSSKVETNQLQLF